MFELFSAFFPILTSFSLKPLTRNHSYIMVYYVFLIRVCDDHSATWHFYIPSDSCSSTNIVIRKIILNKSFPQSNVAAVLTVLT